MFGILKNNNNNVDNKEKNSNHIKSNSLVFVGIYFASFWYMDWFAYLHA